MPGGVVFDLALPLEVIDTAEVVEFAIQSIRRIFVDNNDKRYVLRRGIPQGSKLSSALCHIYYGHMVKEHLTDWLAQPEDLLIRVVDDFLYLTPDGARARRFYQRIHQGFPDYRAYINMSKTTTNVDIASIEADPSPPSVVVPRPGGSIWSSFCGLQFNARTLELRGDYTKYDGTDIISCITPSAGQPGELLLQRLQAIATLKIEVGLTLTIFAQNASEN